jgi:hypothetical protein
MKRLFFWQALKWHLSIQRLDRVEAFLISLNPIKFTKGRSPSIVEDIINLSALLDVDEGSFYSGLLMNFLWKMFNFSQVKQSFRNRGSQS